MMLRRFFFTVLLFQAVLLYCQTDRLPLSVITFSGDNLSVESMSLSYTAGEPVADLITSSNFYVNQGFQQTFDSLVNTGYTFQPAVEGIDVFPNPFQRSLNIINKSPYSISGIIILSSQGQLLYSNKNFDTQKKILLEELTDGLYILRIQFESGKYSYYKLIKSGVF